MSNYYQQILNIKQRIIYLEHYEILSSIANYPHFVFLYANIIAFDYFLKKTLTLSHLNKFPDTRRQTKNKSSLKSKVLIGWLKSCA